MVKRKGKIGQRFGRLVIVEDTKKRTKNREVIFLCHCDCGKEIEVRSPLLYRGTTKSCGCLFRDTRPTNLDNANEAKKLVNGVHVELFSGKISKANSTGYRGVHHCPGGYKASLTVKGVHHSGVCRKTAKKAYEDRLKLEKRYLPMQQKKGSIMHDK